MKKLFTLFLMALLPLVASADADAVEIDGIYYNLFLSTKSAEVTQNPNQYSGEIIIPETVTYEETVYNVTSIGWLAFYGCTSLTSVTIPNSVTSLDYYAFKGCSGLTSITIPNSVTSIGYEAFEGCTSLTSVTIPNSVTSIGGKAFEGSPWYDNQPDGVVYAGKVLYKYKGTMPGGTKISIKDGTLGIAGYAFFRCSGLTSITIPNSVTNIGDDAFEGCSGLTSVTIPNSVTSIGDEAFLNCYGLTSVTIGNSVTTIGYKAFVCTAWYDNQPDGVVYAGKVLYKYKGTMPEGTKISIKDGTLGITGYAFSGCSGLTSVNIPNSVTSIGRNAFSGCSGLTSVSIPNSVTYIGGYAFYGVGLTSVTIPNSVTYLGTNVFTDCRSLTSVTIPNSVTSIAWGTFSSCTALTSITIPNSVTSIKDYAFSSCTGLTSITIPNSVTSIKDYAFSSCTGLTSITIPNSVTSIGEGAFSSCTSLTSVHISDIAAWCKIAFNLDYSNPLEYAHHLFLNGVEIMDLVIPNSVTSIGDGAFKGCSGLTSVTIPNSVTSIKWCAFYGCNGLTSVTIPSSVKSIELGAFYGCSGLTSITIPNSVTSIGERAFSGCDLSVVISKTENPFDIPATTFSDNTFSNATLYVPTGTIDKYKASEGWKKFVLIKEEAAVDEIKITSAGQTTWCSAYDLDFTDVEGLKAYIASGYHRTKGTIWLTRVKEVPAGEGILLIGDAGDYKIPHLATTAYYANLMVGTVEAITINETDGEYTNYYLSNGASGIGFYKVNGSVDIKANRAYLPLLKNTVSSTRGFIGIDFDDDSDGTTDINSIENGKLNIENDVYYNLQGQRVDNPSKGLYIRNGKKVVIK